MRKFISFSISILLHSLIFIKIEMVPIKKEKSAPPNKNRQTVNNRTVIPNTVSVEIINNIPKSHSGTKTHKNNSKKCKNWYGGIGIATNLITGDVLEVFKGYPADKNGLIVGDSITKVESETGPDISGPVGTNIKLYVYRKSTNQFLTFEIVRSKICTYN